MIYFDNSATTPVHPEVFDAMLPFFKEEYGNPSSKYYSLAENAKKAVEEARFHIAQLLQCDSDEVVFTSGATESNNMVLKGYLDTRTSVRLITTKTEHPSVLDTAQFLESHGAKVHYLHVDSDGYCDVEQLDQILQSDNHLKTLVSVVWGNNEIGTLNDLTTISRICARQGVSLHTDATQVAGKVEINLSSQAISFLSFSSHKIHGPKGIGACIIKKDALGIRTKLTPLLHGGGQESGYRSGTLNVHNIVGFGKAAEIAKRDLRNTMKHLADLEQYLLQKLHAKLSGLTHLNSRAAAKIPGIVNLRFEGVNNELLVKKLADHFAISTGSACSSSKPSHVLQSIGLTLDQVRSSVRISLSRFNTRDEIDLFIDTLTR
ncbi:MULTISPECIES: cysteine desulfurase family protein [Brevibacillus]|uniref:cysteine desulfurase family protein n=1 Tax=Brevibacillus TaxID=55080 RepID=UPI000EED7CAF|nr:cysteine desulfurase family protein [Brevibacillus sp.]HBZ83221.1 cysteine desulfurase DndA [Brevibacillus sp.]